MSELWSVCCRVHPEVEDREDWEWAPEERVVCPMCEYELLLDDRFHTVRPRIVPGDMVKITGITGSTGMARKAVRYKYNPKSNTIPHGVMMSDNSGYYWPEDMLEVIREC